jgi:hypothetical protein
LIHCRIDTRRLADALRANNNVTTLALNGRCSDEDRLVLAQALADNVGLVTLNLNLSWGRITALWQSVARHPKLEKLDLPQCRIFRDSPTYAQKTLRVQAVVDVLRVNTVIHTIGLYRDNFDEEILDSTVYPLLLANMYRPRVGAITEE